MRPIHIGVSGWTYEPWRGSFYPPGLKQKDELGYASQKLGSIEINGTFYSMLRPEHYAAWYVQTRPGFVLALKGPKYLTHVRRLKDFATPLSNFLASGLLGLKDKLGPILWQFPPNLAFDPARFEPFMAALPHDTVNAAKLAEGHSDWMKDRALTTTDQCRPMRHAIEVRHASFKVPEFVELARRYRIAIVVGDTAGRWPLIEDVTADFVYLRMHADETVYPNGYTKPALQTWAKKYLAWSTGVAPSGTSLLTPAVDDGKPREVYAYFDNDTKETAPFDAMSMMSCLGIAQAPESAIEVPVSAVRSAPKRAKAGPSKATKASAKKSTKPAKRPSKRSSAA